MLIGHPGLVPEAAERREVRIHGRMLRLITIDRRHRRRQSDHRLRRLTQAAATTRMVDTRTEAARTSHQHAPARRVIRTPRRITTAVVDARTRRLLIPLRAAAIRLRRALIQRRRRGLTRHQRRHGPTQRLRARTPRRAVVTVGVEGRVIVEAEVALAVEAAAEDRMVAVLTEAVHTDTKISAKSPLLNWGGLFLCRGR